MDESVQAQTGAILGMQSANLAVSAYASDQALSRAFRLAGHEATVRDNAARALDLLRNERFDMMLSDVVMPGKDGLSLLQDVRNRASARRSS